MPQSGLFPGVGVLLAGFIFCLTCPDGMLHAQEPPAFEVSLTELPVGDTPSLNPTKLAADGTVVGSVQIPIGDGLTETHAVRLLPGADEFEDLDGSPAFSVINLLPLITADASTILTNRIEMDDEEFLLGVPSTWTEADEWQPLPSLVLLTSFLQGMSDDGSYIVGRGRDEHFSEDQPWIWSVDDGQQVLPILLERVGGEGFGVSDDGTVVAGSQWDLEGTGFDPRRDFGTRWVDGDPEELLDPQGDNLGPVFACSADCSVLAGSRQGGDIDFGHPNWGQAWYWTESEGAVYLGTIPKAEEGMPYFATDISADGSMIIGTYSILIDDGSGFPIPVFRGFIWTAATGMVPIPALLAENDLLDDDWYDMVPSAISPDGDMVLLTGMDLDFNPKSAILHLESAGGGGPVPEAQPVPVLGPAAVVLLGLGVLLVAWRRMA